MPLEGFNIVAKVLNCAFSISDQVLVADGSGFNIDWLMQ
ncbi:hypothetical protein SP19_93 [Salmonella phage 19]|nr:hypothetical protein SP19_93 [Salmonella phage 19]